jgi:hypothetical protein
MFARTSTWSGSPDALQRWSDGTAAVKAFVEGLPGNAGVTFLAPASGTRPQRAVGRPARVLDV